MILIALGRVDIRPILEIETIDQDCADWDLDEKYRVTLAILLLTSELLPNTGSVMDCTDHNETIG